MAKTVKLPLIGQANKGTVIGVSIGGLAVAGYLIYRQQKKSKDAAAATAAAAASSGYGYGYGSYMGNGYFGYGEPPSQGSSGGFYPGYYGYGVTQPQPTAMATDAQWTQAAISQLTSEGYDSQTVSAALGAYITGNNVTAAQVPIVQAAIAVEGYPPVPGANGFPPAVKTGGTPGGGQGGGGTVAVPNVIGMNRSKSKATIEAAGLVYKQANIIRGTAHATKEEPPANTQVAKASQVVVTMSPGRPTM